MLHIHFNSSLAPSRTSVRAVHAYMCDSSLTLLNDLMAGELPSHFSLIYHSRTSLDGWAPNRTSIVSGGEEQVAWCFTMRGNSRRGSFSLKKPISPACCSLLICPVKSILMDLIQASSLTALCYLLILAFIYQCVYKPQYTKDLAWALWSLPLKGLSTNMCVVKPN